MSLGSATTVRPSAVASGRAVARPRGSGLLVMDCSYCEGEGPEHLGLEGVLEVRKRVPPRTAIILTHLDDAPDVAIEGLLVAHDFASFRFP